MENLSMCRICLATDVRLCSIASHLRDMYERITSVTFKREDGRPLVACYICHARLQNCNRLRTSCLQSEELLTEIMSSGMLKPQDVLSTNTFRVVSALHFSLGHALQDSTVCHVKEEASEGISDAELDQLYPEDIVTEAQEEKCAPHDVIKEEADDVETDAEYINLEDGNIKIEEISWEPHLIGSQSADNICPKIVKVVLERIDLNDSRIGARVSLKDAKDAPANKRKIEVIKNEQKETITIKEPEIVTKKLEVEKPVSKCEILVTREKVNKCDYNVFTSVVNDVCERKSTNGTSLEENVSSISSRKNKAFSCDICNKRFSYKQAFKNHILKHTSDSPYQCNVCKKCFYQKGYLKYHIRTHTGEKPYQCNVCKKCFCQKSQLNIHIRIHTGERPYQCYVCKKLFYQKSHLQIHIRTHTGEKPYQCDVCKKYFNTKSELSIHILTHTGEKPHQCNVCKKCFNRKRYLENHLRAHTGEKPYQCNVCKKCFYRKGTLKIHIRTHTGERPYQCNVCKKGFYKKGHLLTHIPTHTGKKP